VPEEERLPVQSRKIDTGLLRPEYDSRQPLYQRLIDETAFILNKGLSRGGITAFDIRKRVKTFEKFSEKILRYEIHENFFDRIEDIAGVRVVCLYRSDLDRVESVIREKFKVASAKIRTRGNPSHEFGYVSDHFIVRLKDELHGPRYDDLKALNCEIQSRTILMDAWAAISQHLDYKQDHDIPTALKRDFYALVGLFHIADSEFDILRQARENSIGLLASTSPSGEFNTNYELNMDTLTAYLQRRFPDRRVAPAEEVSKLVADLSRSKFKTFQRIDPAVTRYGRILQDFERQNPPFSVDSRFSCVGALRTILCIASGEFCEIAGRSNEVFEEYRSRA
jgi:ppGpp synthetase/RelA/SpoT-type nucleotidyltranferase